MPKFIRIITKPFKKFLSLIFRPSPRGRIRWLVFGILVLFLVSGVVDYPQYYNQSADWLSQKTFVKLPRLGDIPFHLGLDLQGGTHLVYQADLSQISEIDRADAMEGVRDVIERRVNFFGISEPIIQISGSNRLVVELAGVSDVNQAIEMIGETPLLEFKERGTEPAEPLTEEQLAEMDAINEAARQNARETLDKLKTGQFAFEDLVRDHSEDELTRDQGGDLDFIGSRDNVEIYNKAAEIGLGNVSQEIFQSREGYEIIRVDDQREAGEEIKASHVLICHQQSAACANDRSKEDALTLINQLKEQATPENFADLAVQNSEEPGADQRAGDLGYFTRGEMVAEFENPAFELVVGEISDVVETAFGYHLIHKTDQRPLIEYKVSHILFKTRTPDFYTGGAGEFKNTGLSGTHLKRAQVTFHPQTNDIQVTLEFNEEGKNLFAEITRKNIGQPIAIFLDGQPISIPTVQDEIRDGIAVISGSFTIEDAKLLSQRLNAGALPVPISLLSQQTVGATLGRQSVQDSLMAALIGLILVGLFMIIYYRLPGLIAVIALLIYGSINLALYKLALPVLWSMAIILLVILFVSRKIFQSKYPDFEKIVFFIIAVVLSVFLYVILTAPVTLTLAGIAGFVLSLGMAVDANVLIFERIKEELGFDKPLVSAIDIGFKRAWSSIQDGNISTLITCLILSFFGTSIIKGFAITLGIGILVSMFTAVLITRTLLLLVTHWRIGKAGWLYRQSRHKS